MDLTYQNIDYVGDSGVHIVEAGELQTDKYGLSTCTAKFRTRASNWASFPRMNTVHPIFSSLWGEKKSISFAGPWVYQTIGYAGLDPNDTGGSNAAESAPIYELVVGLSEDHIETNPNFITFIGGKPTAPLNGCVFRLAIGENAGALTNGKAPAETDTGYVFDHFLLIGADGKRNPYAKVESYMNATKITWRKTWVSTANPKDNKKAGYIDTPPGTPPSIEPGNWLNMGFSSTQRGKVFMISESWMSSGPLGWLKPVYTAPSA